MKQTRAAREFAHYPQDWHFSPVLISGDFAFFSGQTGVRPDETLSSDPEQQFRDAFSFLAANLSAAELSFRDIVEMTTYHVDLRRHFADFIKVKDEFVHPLYPAWTAIGVAELLTPGTLVEIRVIARRSVSAWPSVRNSFRLSPPQETYPQAGIAACRGAESSLDSGLR